MINKRRITRNSFRKNIWKIINRITSSSKRGDKYYLFFKWRRKNY